MSAFQETARRVTSFRRRETYRRREGVIEARLADVALDSARHTGTASSPREEGKERGPERKAARSCLPIGSCGRQRMFFSVRRNWYAATWQRRSCVDVEVRGVNNMKLMVIGEV